MSSNNHILLDINSLLAGEWAPCQALLLHNYPYELQGKTIDKQQLCQLLNQDHIPNDQSLLDFLQSKLKPVECFSPEQFSILKFSDEFFTNYLKNNYLDNCINQSLALLRPAIASSLLQEKLPWSEQIGLAQLLNNIHNNSIGCQESLGKPAVRFTQQLTTHFQKHHTPKEIADTLNVFFEKEKTRIKKLETRLHDAELGALHAKHASQLSAKTLNQYMGGKKLPETISNFLQGPWRESMRLIIINDGKLSDRWKTILRLTETLIWSFQPFDRNDSNYQQHVYQSISEISEQLREVAIGLHHSNKLDDELATIETEHLNILKGVNLEYHPFQLIDNTDPLLSSQVSISNALIKNATAYEEGQWFIDNNDGNEKRIKLSFKITQAQQLLFTNFLGIKSAQYSFEEFAYRLSSKTIIPIRTKDTFKATGEKTIGDILQRYQQQQQKIANEESIEKETLRQQEISREAAKEKALKEAEAHAKAKEAARIITQQQNEKLQATQKQQEKHQEIQRQLNKFTLGGTVIFYDEERKDERCKLAAIIQSSGDHIFVNRQGIKRHTLNKQQLIEKLMDNSAKIIDCGSSFDSTLETVVNNLRARK